jgi:RNA polymerase sigma-70 factor, ECF subfamily
VTFLRQAELPETYRPYEVLRNDLGFLPGVFPAQSLLPRLIEAEARLLQAVLIAPGSLSRVHKEEILLAVAAASASRYCATAYARGLASLGVEENYIDSLISGKCPDAMDPRQVALIQFALRLARHPLSVGQPDFETLRSLQLSDPEILETILTTSLAAFFCTLSAGLGVDPDFEPIVLPDQPETPSSAVAERAASPYLSAPIRRAEEFPPFEFLRASFGFVPKIFKAQTLRPEALDAETQLIRDILLTEDALSRKQKHLIVLVVSAANRNTACVAVHSEMLRVLGVPSEVSDQVVNDLRNSPLAESDSALLNIARKLATQPRQYADTDRAALRAQGFADAQILEAIATASLANFLNTLQMGLGTAPDFRPRRDFLADLQTRGGPDASGASPSREAPPDPDAPLVARAQAGDTAAFEALVRQHQARVYRMLAGITGQAEDAEDCTQVVFVKVFRKLGDFSGASRFSTWLTRIAINEGLERLRSRRPEESAEIDGPDADFRPASFGQWVEDPERLYARDELRGIVQRELAKLPTRYRMAVLVRDIEQLSTAEAATALGIPIPTLKTRLLRGRLMMREALAAYFADAPRGGRNADL